MRALVFLLILANLLFFAYAGGYFGTGASPDALRGQQQINPERLQLLARAGEAAPAPAPAPSLAAPPEPVPEPAAAPGAPAPESKPAEARPAEVKPEPAPPKESDKPPVPDKVVKGSRCILISGLQIDAVETLVAQAEAAKLKASRRSEGSWWVFIPPQGDKKGADKKAGELQRLGVKEFFVVTEGAQQFAISLGVFSREEAAQKRLEQLQSQGVRSARVGPRQAEGARQLLEVRGDAGALATLRQGLPAGSGSKDCQ